MEANDALVMVFARNAFYKRLHYLALAAFALALVVIGVLIGVIIYLMEHPVSPLFFATDEVGRLIKIIPVNQPNMPIDDVKAWTIEAVEAAYSYDYINYRSQLQDAQKYFTSYGWTKYMGALQASNNLLALTDKKMVVIAKVAGPLKLVTQGILGGSYAYKFEMPVLVTYWRPPYNETSKFSNPLLVSVIVQRREILQSYKGLGVVQIIGELISSAQPQTISGSSTGG